MMAVKVHTPCSRISLTKVRAALGGTIQRGEGEGGVGAVVETAGAEVVIVIVMQGGTRGGTIGGMRGGIRLGEMNSGVKIPGRKL